MKPLFCAAIVAASITIGATIPARAQANNPILEELRPQLQAALAKVAPDATWELKGNELAASYKTQVFTVHSANVWGVFIQQSHEEIGPADGGFILRLRVFSDLPYFAIDYPHNERQERWKTFLTRANLRMGNATSFAMDEPEILQTEREGQRRPHATMEMGPASPLIQAKLARLEDAGLISIARDRKFYASVPARYAISSKLAELQDKIPDLGKNKTRRMRALQAATAKVGRKLSPSEIELLDSEIRDLQTEFYGDLQRINSRGSFLEPRYPDIRQRLINANKPGYLVFTLQTPLNNEILLLQPFVQIVEDAAREYNRRADEK